MDLDMDTASKELNLDIANSDKIKSKKKAAIALLKLCISASLLFIVYRSVDTNKLYHTLSSVSLIGFLQLCALYFLGQFISVFKWRIFLNSAGIEKDLPSILRAYFFGMFINAFAGIGTIGGDLARSIALKPEKGFRAASLASVIADRVHGLATLLLIGSISIAIFRPENLGNFIIISSALGSMLLLSIWILGPGILLRIVPNKFAVMAQSITQAFPRDLKKLLGAGLISLTMHCIQVTMVYLITKQLHSNLNLSYLFCTVPIVNAASTLPISTNGLGVRETMFHYFFSPYGISIEQTVAFGAMWVIVVSIVSALGGILLAPGLIFKKIKDE